LLEQLEEAVDESTGLVLIDYAQAFDAEPDEKSVERVIARLAWGLNQLAKKHNIAIVLFSQLKAEVKERGNRWYENFRYKKQEEATETSFEAVEGFRPRDGDLQWSSALYQRAKQIVYIFRPAAWLQAFGIQAKDNFVQMQIAKGNYGPNKKILEFGWSGETARIFERKKKA
jgi:replicative DNA helicase